MIVPALCALHNFICIFDTEEIRSFPDVMLSYLDSVDLDGESGNVEYTSQSTEARAHVKRFQSDIMDGMYQTVLAGRQQAA
jgi:hypothetical protein